MFQGWLPQASQCIAISPRAMGQRQSETREKAKAISFRPKKSTASCFMFSKPSKHLWIGRITHEAPFPAAIQCHSFSKYIWVDYYVLVRWPGHIIILSFLKEKKKNTKADGKDCIRAPPSPVYISELGSLEWRKQWHPTPVLLPGKSHEWRSLVGCSPWGR